MSDTTDQIVGIDFAALGWEKWTKPGALGRVKMVLSGRHRVRLLELPPGFSEEEWCLRGHTGYVLAGEFVIRFKDHEVPCAPGMGFVIPDDVPHRSRGLYDGATTVFVVDEIPS
jgi:hypothetical protein